MNQASFSVDKLARLLEHNHHDLRSAFRELAKDVSAAWLLALLTLQLLAVSAFVDR